MALNPYEGPSGFGAFLRSALSAAGPELFGNQPSSDIQLYRANNPTGSAVSQIAGFLVPAVGTTAAVSRIPRFARVLETVGNAERMAAAPFVTRAQVEALRYAPFEVGRTLGALTFGDNADEVAKEGVINIAAAGGIGGIIGKLASGTRPFVGKSDLGKITDIVPGFDATAPAQIRTQVLRDALVAQPQEAELFGRVIRANTEETFAQAPAEGEKSVLSIAGDKEATRSVDRLFRLRGNEEGLKTGQLNTSPSGFNTVGDQQAFFNAAGIADKDQFASSVLYPRFIQTNSEASAKRIQGTMDAGFWNQADGWKYVKEDGGNNMVVMAKKVAGDVGLAKKGDQWVIFKTAKPENFAQNVAQDVKNLQAKWGSLWPSVDTAAMDQAGLSSRLYQTIKAGDAAAGPETGVQAAARIGKDVTQESLASRAAQQLADTAIGKKIGSVVYDPVGRLGQIAREYVVPTEFQATAPRARGIFGLAKISRDAGIALAHEAFYGSTEKLKTAFKYIANVPRSGGIEAKLNALRGDNAAVAQLQQALVRNIPLQEAEGMGFGKKVLDVLKSLAEADTVSNAEIALAKKVAGIEGGFQPLDNHYLFTRTWRGEHRAEVISGTEGPGQRMAIYGGRTPAEAKLVAQTMVDELKQRGITARVGQQWTRTDSSQDLAEAAKIVKDARIARSMDEATEATVKKAYTPGFAKERLGGKGFIGDITAPKEYSRLSVDEVSKIVSDHLEGKYKYAAQLMYEARIAGQMQKLAAENPNLGAVIADRVNKVWGRQGDISKVVNSVADKFLAPWMGGNSASKIAQAVNTGMFHLSFGFLNTGFPILNAMTTIITAPAEISLLQSGRASTLLKYYNMIPVMGADGLPRGATGVVDNWKLMRESFRQMGKPEPGFMDRLHRGALEGVTDPRFAEEMIGQNSKLALNLKGVLNGEQGLTRTLLEFSKLMPSASEKFARIWAFTVGDNVAQKIFNIQDPERIYQFAKRFTERTMYNYASADRALVMTGPIGSVFGLYKNWMMHYLGNWMIYAGEGVLANNWKPLLWATATAWSAGGALGAGPASMLVNGAANFFGDKKTPVESLYDWFGGKGIAADAAMYGLPGLFGMSLVSSGSAPGSEVMKDMGFLVNLAIWDRAKAAGKFLGNVGSAVSSGVASPQHSQLIAENFYRAFAPRSLYRAMAVLEDNNLRSMQTGTPLLKDQSFLHRVMYTFGLNPVEVDNTLALGRTLFDDNNRLKLQVEWLGRRWEEAQRHQDWNEMNRVMGQGIGLGIMDQVMHSVQSRSSREAKDIISATSKAADLGARRENLGIRQ